MKFIGNELNKCVWIYELQLKAITELEKMSLINSLSATFKIEPRDLHAWVLNGEEPGEWNEVRKYAV